MFEHILVILLFAISMAFVLCFIVSAWHGLESNRFRFVLLGVLFLFLAWQTTKYIFDLTHPPQAGTGGSVNVDGLPFFLSAEVLKPFITEELRLSTTPIFFRLKGGQRAVGKDFGIGSQ